MRRKYLLDTNQLTHAAANRGSPVVKRIRQVSSAGDAVGVCVPVLCEAHAGFAGLSEAKREHYLEELRHLMRLLRLWPLDSDAAVEYGRIYQSCRQVGRVLSPVDMMLAALAREERLILVTADRDFDALPDLRIEDWTLE
ncbi:PIN domain-containing protein [Humisphaera borealis]|uniref:Ribonuclease VapC n=1 Tax=Humisphaera borealis TaxID=2807512 RepID=A0A7M2WRQ7_9BACT|nr:PIN domain-containing protein [Humisphaera borealis]